LGFWEGGSLRSHPFLGGVTARIAAKFFEMRIELQPQELGFTVAGRLAEPLDHMIGVHRRPRKAGNIDPPDSQRRELVPVPQARRGPNSPAKPNGNLAGFPRFAHRKKQTTTESK